MDLVALLLGRIGQRGHVGRQESMLDGSAEGAAQDAADHRHPTGGQLGSRLGPEQSFHVAHGQLDERDPTQTRNQVHAHDRLVAGEG